MTRKLWVGLLVCFAVPAYADIYKCVDADGHVTYSNIDTRGCKRLNLEPTSTSTPASSSPARQKSSATPTPGDFPRVDPLTQKARDSDRRVILDQELASEKAALQQARQELATQEAGNKGSDKLQAYRDRVSQHERNVDALTRELSNLR
jgi:hypothetical protein